VAAIIRVMPFDRGGDVVFLRAADERLDDVLSVLDEAAGWLEARGISQWPARFEAAWVQEALSRGETWLVEVGGKVAGTVTVDWSDRLWADVAGTAGYVHRMAVRRWATGLGAVILGWAADSARQRGVDALRLDCVKSNDRLRSYYEARGFVHRGDVPVGGTPGQRRDDGPVTWVSRYEYSLAVG
jgi:Acetyltransferase (GNAT) family